MAEIDELKDLLPGAAARVDAMRAAGLTTLDHATGARESTLKRERDRLARHLGEDHPRVQALAARLESAAALRQRLAVEVVRAGTASPRVDAQGWALHGYVRCADSKPAVDVTVSLVDDRGQFLKGLGFACTDARGYFRITARVEHAPDGSAAIQTSFIRVTDADRKQLYRAAEPLSVLPGAVEYREIVLDGSVRACSPPEEERPGPAPTKERPRPRGGKREREKA
jgi:hypothetical protein